MVRPNLSHYALFAEPQHALSSTLLTCNLYNIKIDTKQATTMAQSREGGREHEKLLDFRVKFRNREKLAFRALMYYWPSVPGRDCIGEEAAVDCMVIVVKSSWANLEPERRPEPQAGEDAFTRYIWMLFDSDIAGYGELRDSARKDAVALIREELGPGFTFETLCRSKIVVNNLWAVSCNQLTFTEFIQGPDHPQGKIVCKGAEMATKGFLEWDGVACPSLAELTSKVTKQTQLPDGNTHFVYFRAPFLLEVRFTPGDGCKHSLKDIFQFSTDTWVLHKVDESLFRMRQEGKQAYRLMAVVKHRDRPEGADCVRVFWKDGLEQLPIIAANRAVPDWGFKADESIPSGVKLSLFYATVPGVSEDVVINERKVCYHVPDDVRHRTQAFSRLWAAKKGRGGLPGKS